MDTNLNNSDFISNFDLQDYYGNSNFKSKYYDEHPIFKQGIAIVRKNGKFGAVMVGGKEIVPPIYDDLSEFKDGYAIAKWNNENRVVNLSGQIQVLKDGKEIFLPEEYDWGFDFVNNICVVVKNGKYGIIDLNAKVKQECKYESIEVLSDAIFKFKEGSMWGLLDISGNIIAKADYENIVNETDSLLKVESYIQNGNSKDFRYGFLDYLGNIIVPPQSQIIKKIEYENNIFFIIEINYKQGVIDKRGKIIIPFIYNYIYQLAEDNFFYCKNYQYEDVDAIYNFNGVHWLKINDKQYAIIPTEYEYAYYVGYRLIKVSKNCMWGLIDIAGNVIVEPKFACINEFDGSFSIVGVSLNDQEYTYLGKGCNNKTLLYGLIDTSGDVVLPTEYKEIEKWDNGYYVVCKNDLYGLLSPTLHLLIDPCKEYLKKLDDNYIFIKERSEWSNTYLGLIDYYGNEIIPTYKDLSEVEILENGFIKVIYQKSQYNGNSHIGILNNKGKKIYDNTRCDDITYIGNGLFLVVEHYEHLYNIANFQGKELFDTYYSYIKVLDNGDFLICKNKCYGLAKNTGQIFILPKYANEIKFENGFAKIKVKGSSQEHKINYSGQVFVSDLNKNEIKIPNKYYWGTDFVNGISIVRVNNRVNNRDSFFYRDFIGVINEQGNIIIPPKYKEIKLLSNNTLLVGDDYFYGLYDITGKCILPVVFTSIEYINQDCIRVVWNLDFVKSWKSGDDTCDVDKNKLVSNGVELWVNNRSALCNIKGQIINDKSFIYVETFENVYGYARAYCTAYIDENHRLKREQAGIIDINGKTIVHPKYDGIILYGSYARLRKGNIYGIADLQNKQIKLFKEINIKKTKEIDSFGRFIYIDGDCCNNQTENQGVMGLNGIILPPGKYSNIELLKNGLIQVSNEDNTLYGLLDLNGKELLKMEYSYISSFMYGCASVCIGGYYKEEEFFPCSYKLIGGKWGVIDKTGKFIVECIYDEEQELSAEDIIKHNLLDVSEFDSYGRFLFTRWKSLSNSIVGVIGLNGIIVPTGKYPNIDLLDNGLIMISDEKKQLFGLLGLDGKELLEMKYSYISTFKNGCASVCIGGYNKGDILCEHVGGKWGLIDETGKILVECIHDEDLSLIKEDDSTINLFDETNVPKILCSDFIPNEELSDNNYYSYDNDYGYDDDTSSVYDNPYYNDNLDMDQQSIDFWNNL